jgi:hypothetical protein
MKYLRIEMTGWSFSHRQILFGMANDLHEGNMGGKVFFFCVNENRDENSKF